MVFQQNNEADDYHVFVSDSEWMRELGLATFTTGTLYDWWYKKDEAGAWLNRPLINGDPSKQSPSVFFHAFTAVVPGTAKVWRFTADNKGKYQEETFDEGWTYADGRRE